MTTAEKLIKNKLGLLQLASYLQNVSEACRVMGYSRDTFYRVKKAHDDWIDDYNTKRPHQGKRCRGKTPMETFLENVPLAKEKILDMKEDNMTLAA